MKKTLLYAGIMVLTSVMAVHAAYNDHLELFKQGKYQESLSGIAAELKVADDFVPGSPNYQLRYLAAHNHWKMGNHKNAIAHLTRCAEIDTKKIDPYIDMALVSIDAGNMEEANRYCRLALTIQPESAIAYYVLGLVRLRYKNFWGAKEFFEKSIGINSDMYMSYNGLGQAFMGLGRFGEANTAFSTANALRPNSFEILNNLAAVIISLEAGEESGNNETGGQNKSLECCCYSEYDHAGKRQVRGSHGGWEMPACGYSSSRDCEEHLRHPGMVLKKEGVCDGLQNFGKLYGMRYLCK
jgi:tetratricopeptide (TPR) repeat protein